MDNINMSSTPVKQGMGSGNQQQLQRKSHGFSAKLISFVSAFLILLASVFAVNISTINSVEAKSQSAEYKTKKKKYRKASRKSRRYKRSRQSRKSKKRYKKGKRYKARYKKSRRYKKGKRFYKTRYKKSKRYRKGKRFYKTRYKKSKRYRKGKRYYKKSRKNRKIRKSWKNRKKTRKARRSRVVTCDQLSASTLNKKARRYQETINHAARQHGVSQYFIKAVITVETCFRSGLRGTSGEKGLMQLMPATAKRFGVKNRFSTWQNIHGGARYLSYLLRRFKGNKAYAAAGYNGGAGAVSRTTGPKFEAVRRYSRKVMNAYRKFKPSRIKVKARKRKSRKKKRS